MPLRRKQEVCGKPTQYNLQTCEYAWRELPDTHCVVPGRGRVGDAAPRAQVQPRIAPSDAARLPRSPSPAPLPSKPIQEHFGHAPPPLSPLSPRLATPPAAAPLYRDGQPVDVYAPYTRMPPPTPSAAPALPSPARNDSPSRPAPAVSLPAWSHDELRRLVCTNETEAHYSYLPPRLPR